MSADGSRRGLKVGLTGGIGSGKSAVAQLLAGLGAEVLDADEVARRQLEPGQDVFNRVVARFGRGILDAQGRVDRAALARRVFADADEREALNSLTHPAVLEHIAEWAGLTQARGKVAVAEIPLLFEAGAEGLFDAVICVAADEATALARLRARGWSDEDSLRRMRAQWPLEEKKRRSDFVIENNGDLESLRRETMRTFNAILNKERGQHA